MNVVLAMAVGFGFRCFVALALAAHLLAAVGYWWLSPSGFPADHPRFYLNSVLPVAISVAAIAGLLAMHWGRQIVAATIVLCFALGWAAIAVSGRVFFPTSLRLLWLLPLLTAAVGLCCCKLLARGQRRPTRIWLLCGAVSAFVGVWMMWSQQPPTPATQPIDERPPRIAPQDEPSRINATVKVGEVAEFYPGAATFAVSTGGLRLVCSPLLEFDRISPDGFWSIFAGQSRRPRRYRSRSNVDGGDTFHYSDDAIIILPAPTSRNVVGLTAYTPVLLDAYSHLNSYGEFTISGHEQLSLVFSPCPGAKIDVLPADYPVGQPARFAYIDSAERFVVAEATSGEKGPFRTLARGPLGRGQALTIELHDGERHAASITLEDWSRQAATDLSPTAGWGVPMNAIEFQCAGNRRDSAAMIWISLASTSVGRGWDTVGHRAGTYRNRMTIRTAEQ
jgi:hypothetical protein